MRFRGLEKGLEAFFKSQRHIFGEKLMQIWEKVAAFSLMYIGGSLRSSKSFKYEVISKSNLFFNFCRMNKPFEFWMRQDH